MPTNDRPNTSDLTSSYAEASIQDLPPKHLNEEAAEEVKGGKGNPGDFNFVHLVDKASTRLPVTTPPPPPPQ
jgi:hypothetical protein